MGDWTESRSPGTKFSSEWPLMNPSFPCGTKFNRFLRPFSVILTENMDWQEFRVTSFPLKLIAIYLTVSIVSSINAFVLGTFLRVHMAEGLSIGLQEPLTEVWDCCASPEEFGCLSSSWSSHYSHAEVFSLLDSRKFLAKKDISTYLKRNSKPRKRSLK